MQPEIKTLPTNGQEKKQPTPIQQWDQLAFSVIYQELGDAGIRKQKIKTCQQISAQLVRGFRERAKSSYKEQLAMANGALRTCKWWQFGMKQLCRTMIKTIETCVKSLDEVTIK